MGKLAIEEHLKIKKMIRQNIYSIISLLFADWLLYLNLTSGLGGRKLIQDISKNESLKLVIIVGIFIICFLSYNFLYYFIVSHKKTDAPLIDFFSTAGRQVIKQNYENYFDDQYIYYYKMYCKISYLYVLILLALLILNIMPLLR